jgi:hypothetical protein
MATLGPRDAGEHLQHLRLAGARGAEESQALRGAGELHVQLEARAAVAQVFGQRDVPTQ